VRLAITVSSGARHEDWRYALPNGSVTEIDATAHEVTILRIPTPV